MRQVVVEGARIDLADILQGRDDLAHVDLGPAPQVGGSRLITRADIKRALDELGAAGDEAAAEVAEASLPKSVRVVRKSERLDVARQMALVREGLHLPRGVDLVKVRPQAARQVPTGWDRVAVSMPKPPRREGDWSSSARIELFAGDVPVTTLSAAVDLRISAEGAKAQVERGHVLTLVVRRGQVEVQVRAIANVDGDVGDVITVRIASSGKTLRAAIETPDRAIAQEDR